MKTNKIVLAVAVMVSLVAGATQYSKLSIVLAAKEHGCWDGMKRWIEKEGIAEEWFVCQYVNDEYPMFSAVTNRIVSDGVVDYSSLTNILAISRDTSVPDKALRRVYENEVRTISGRTKWHGRKIRECVDTNSMTSVTYFEDGTTFTDRARILTAAASVKAQNERLRMAAMTNGIPARLAAARMRYASGATNEVTVSLSTR